MVCNPDELFRTRSSARRFFVREIGGVLFLTVVAVLSCVACGQVVTVETPTPAPTAEATAASLALTVAPRPTVTRALPTATKPNTPTPSPTPVIHIVQSGETLIAIALKYGVTVPALQAANGIADPAALQVNQALVVPVGATNEAGNSGALMPSPTPLSFPIEGLGCYEEPVGSVWCLGEVVNSTSTSMENVQLRVTLYDAEGMQLASGDVQAALDLILSGQRAPFGVLFTSPPEDFRFAAAPIRAEASSEPASRYAELELKQVNAEPVGSLFQVTGMLMNPNPQPVRTVIVVVTTYDAAGQVTGFRRSQVADELGAGAEIEFIVSLMPDRGTPANYSISLQGRLPTS